MSNVCKICGAMYCAHIQEGYSSLGSAISTYTDVHSDVFDDGNPLNVGSSNPNLKPMANTIPSKVTDISGDWVTCNLCTSRINIRYLDQHLKVHIYKHPHKGADSTSTTTSASSSTALTRIAPTTETQTTSWTYPEKKEPKIQSLETYKFKTLDSVCAAGSQSKAGRYSDFTLVFWGEEKTVVQNSNYYGYGSYSSYTSKDWERLHIHVIYDSVEDYYTVSCKILRRSSYSTYDSDDCIPDRICYQHELMTEIKRALLFFRVSPKVAYKKFRKLFKQTFDITYSDGKALIVQTKNCEDLNKKLAPTSYSAVTSSSTRYNEDFPNHNRHENWTDI